MVFKMLLIFFCYLVSFAAPSPVVTSAMETRDHVNAMPNNVTSSAGSANKSVVKTSRSTGNIPPSGSCHFDVTLERRCGRDYKYEINVHNFRDGSNELIKGVENDNRWLFGFEKQEVTLGKVAGIPLTAKYNEKGDYILWTYPMQQWFDDDHFCYNRVGWKGDHWNGDRDNCGEKWYLWYREFSCYFDCFP